MTSTFRSETGVRVPAVTADEMREVDRVAVEAFGLSLARMMENAGRTLARHVRALGDGPVRVVAGNGGNGGGGLVCARHLANRGRAVAVVLDRDPDALDGAAATQLGVLDAMGVPIRRGFDREGDALDGVVVDALVGYGLSGALRGRARTLVAATNRAPAPVVSLDVPSGRDATSGDAPGPVVEPDRTVTLALPKTGLRGAGDLFLADIGIPAGVFERAGLAYENPFADDDSTRLAVS
ncbi:MAG: NAD(P)H-hydrate epimerase [Halobacteriales archaeon]